MTRPMPQPALQLDAVTHRYAETQMCFDLEVEAGEWLAVIGPSGAGKSTLLDLAAGFLPPDSGRIWMAGEDVTNKHPAERNVSFVFQEHNLFAHLSAFANVALGLSPRLRLTGAERQRVAAALAAVGLADLSGRKPAAMSGGERQRVALARAFLRERPLLLLDEPFAALGPALRRDMLTLLQGLRHAQPKPVTVVMVTHQPEDTRGFADRVAFLDHGRIAAIGATDAMLGASGGEAVAAYLGS